MASQEFIAGREAAFSGMRQDENPYICGTTKLGATKYSDSDAGCDWGNGWRSVQKRTATLKEIEEAASLDTRQFRRKRNSYYTS